MTAGLPAWHDLDGAKAEIHRWLRVSINFYYKQFRSIKMVLQKALRPLLMASFVLVSGTTNAATSDGSLAGTSEGTADISLNKNDQVQISGLSAVALALQADGGAIGDTTACIYRVGTPGYNLTATGDGASNAFTVELADGSDAIPYTVSFSDAANATPAALSSGTAKTGLLANTDAADCGGTPNVTLAVAVNATDYAAATAGDHTGVLTLLVTPE
jgi:hypothetical protein